MWSTTVFYFYLIFGLFSLCSGDDYFRMMTTDELENHISPEDLKQFLKIQTNESNVVGSTTEAVIDYASFDERAAFDDSENGGPEVPQMVDCFGLGAITRQLPWLFNMKPDTAEEVNTHFYFVSRNNTTRAQVMPGAQFGLEWVDFKPERRTIMIVHGFMSHSNASWVHDMTNAFLQWDDVNVIAVDWSGGGNTWKYWRAVANTRRVGSDVTAFMRRLINETGARTKDFHFIGHSLGAHICSYVSYHLGGINRITGLDPAQPCFRTTSSVERLDSTDADFVDVIHTNGRMLTKIGLGLPDPLGHADFYPNGGMRQPGCSNGTRSIWARLIPTAITRLQQAICSHGRAYILFTESLINNNCSFRAHRWNLTYEGVNSSLVAACDKRGSCSEMGIRAEGSQGLLRATGPYFTLTTEKEPYCPTEWERQNPRADLLRDLLYGFSLDRTKKRKAVNVTPAYADPMEKTVEVQTTTCRSWLKRLFRKIAGKR